MPVYPIGMRLHTSESEIKSVKNDTNKSADAYLIRFPMPKLRFGLKNDVPRLYHSKMGTAGTNWKK